MPTSKSAGKRIRQADKRRTRNRMVKSELTTLRRHLTRTLASGDQAGSEVAFRKYCSLLDKAVKKGAIRINNAARRKARASARLSAL